MLMRCHQMESLSSINSEPLHKHHSWNSQCSEPSDDFFREQWGLSLLRTPLVDRLVGEFILSGAIGLVIRLYLTDFQKENVGLPGSKYPSSPLSVRDKLSLCMDGVVAACMEC